MAHEYKRQAARQVAELIGGRLMAAGGQDPAVKAELERLKATFESVAAAEEPERPEGWTGGSPEVGVCRCNECTDRKVREAKAQGKLQDPTKEG